MRLAILGSRGIPGRYGGFETFAEEIAVRLVKRNAEVTVYCEASVSSNQPDVYRGVRLKYVRAPRLGPLTTLLFDMRCLWHARENHDVVYMLGYGASLFCFVPRLWGSEVWINMDGIEWARSKWNWLAKIWFRTMEMLALWTASRIIADAESIRSHLQGRHRRSPECSIIAYGADIVSEAPNAVLLNEWGVSPTRYYLVVCRLEPENHIREIIQGFVASTSGYPLLIVGDHEAGTSYVKDLLRIRDPRIRFVGTEYNNDRLQVLRWHCRAYFHGHSVGGTNPSLLEALGCGNFVIAHDNSFNREVADSVARYFASVADIPPIVAELDQVNSFELQRKAATARIAQHYTWDKITDQYAALLGI